MMEAAPEKGESGQVCDACGTADDLEFGPDPYAEEIGHDSTPVWECVGCRDQSAMDI